MENLIIKDKIDYKIDVINNEINLALNNSGDLLDSYIKKYIKLDYTEYQCNLPFVSDKVNLVLEAKCESIPESYDHAHFEFILTYNDGFVSDGEKNSDILYKFESKNKDGWIIERNKVYDFPGKGYGYQEAVNNWSVKYIATNLNIDFSLRLYFFYRIRYCQVNNEEVILSDSYSQYNGKYLVLQKSYFSNTGSNKTNQIIVDLLPRLSDIYSEWPDDKYINYEIYLGSSGNPNDYVNGIVSPELHVKSLESPGGFSYFDGESFVLFSGVGVPSSYFGNQCFFITDEINFENCLFAVYRPYWSNGNGNWIIKTLNFKDYIIDDSRTFYPWTEINIGSRQFIRNYYIHIIIGTSPKLIDYFQDGDTEDFSKILYDYDGLIDYSTTKNSSDRVKFFYYKNGSIIHPDGLFNRKSNINIVFKSLSNYNSDQKLFVFWRAEY